MWRGLNKMFLPSTEAAAAAAAAAAAVVVVVVVVINHPTAQRYVEVKVKLSLYTTGRHTEGVEE
jgi:hypothetical protein